jgi:hypothetical protein
MCRWRTFTGGSSLELARDGYEGADMKDLTRRGFLAQSSKGAALAGALAVIPGIGAILKVPAGIKAGAPTGIQEPLIAHVRDLTTGEISLLVGTEQVIQHDRELAARLYAAARRSR